MSTMHRLPSAQRSAGARAGRSVAAKTILAGAPRPASSASQKQQARRLVSPSAATMQAPAPAAAASSTAAPAATGADAERNLAARHREVKKYFPTALGVDDWMSRVETILAAYGFAGDNSIAMTNLCRDEVTAVLKDKIEAAFGSSFNTNGLGGVLTCGATGMGAGLSHSPICDNGRERYVFFSFPHIAIDSKGEVGAIARPGRAGKSCACGALAKCLGEFKAEGIEVNCKTPGVHTPLDPEYSILKQRLARRMRDEDVKVENLTLSSITGIAERTITSDLEGLIEKAVDLSKADYAVVTGVQIHNWSTDLTPAGAPSLEFVAPTNLYVVIGGEKIELDMTQVPSLSPRQLRIMATASVGEGVDGTAISASEGSTLQEIPLTYLMKQLGGAVLSKSSKQASLGQMGVFASGRWQAAVEGRPGAVAAMPKAAPAPKAPAPAAAAPSPAPNTSFGTLAAKGPSSILARPVDSPESKRAAGAHTSAHVPIPAVAPVAAPAAVQSAAASAVATPAAQPAAAAPSSNGSDANASSGSSGSDGGFWGALKAIWFGPNGGKN